MKRELFMTGVYSMREQENYFLIKKDCTGTPGFSSIYRCTHAMKMLALVSWRCKDEYLSMNGSTIIESMHEFCWVVVRKFGIDYLRGPNEEDATYIMGHMKQDDFLDVRKHCCMQWS
jgi:hypothetical protein